MLLSLYRATSALHFTIFSPLRSFRSTLVRLGHFSPSGFIRSTLVLSGHIRFYLVQIGSIRSNLVILGPLWSYSVHFGHIRSIMSTVVLFSPIQSTSGPLWSYSVHSVLFILPWSIWFTLVLSVLVGPL